MTDIVFAHGGTVVKIIGDAMHVLFGAPAEQQDHASRAVACALELDAGSQSFCERWRKKGVALGTTRLGLNAGPAIVGNFGGGRFFEAAQRCRKPQKVLVCWHRCLRRAARRGSEAGDDRVALRVRARSG